MISDAPTIQPRIWQRLQKIQASGKIGSAYLFAGPTGCGKEALAVSLAAALNCEDGPENTPCGKCPSCRRMANLQHENLSLVFPLPREKATSGDDPLQGLSKATLAAINDAIAAKAADPFYKIALRRANTIPISSIREIRKSAYVKTALRGQRLILIFDAHLLGTGEGAAANALLKILEEPPAATTFILVTDYKNDLLPTILSRCQQIDFPPLDDDLIATYLDTGSDNIGVRLARGNLRLARRLVQSDQQEITGRMVELARQVAGLNGDKWREFVNTYGRLAQSQPEEFHRDFMLLEAWFKSAYRLKMRQPDALMAGASQEKMEKFVAADRKSVV